MSLFLLRPPAIPSEKKLIEDILAATDRETLNDATRALDRLLRAEIFWIPQWFKKNHTIAYYDMYRYPEKLPPYDLGTLDFWWFDEAAYNNLKAKGAF